MDNKSIFAIITPVKETTNEKQQKIAVSHYELFELTQKKFVVKFQREIKSGILAIFSKV